MRSTARTMPATLEVTSSEPIDASTAVAQATDTTDKFTRRVAVVALAVLAPVGLVCLYQLVRSPEVSGDRLAVFAGAATVSLVALAGLATNRSGAADPSTVASIALLQQAIKALGTSTPQPPAGGPPPAEPPPVFNAEGKPSGLAADFAFGPGAAAFAAPPPSKPHGEAVEYVPGSQDGMSAGLWLEPDLPPEPPATATGEPDLS